MAYSSKKEILTSPDALKKIESLISQGNTERAVAKALGVSMNTFSRYKKETPAIREAIAEGHSKTITKMINNLIKHASGYFKTDSKIIEVKDKDTGEWVEIKKEKTKKWYKGSDKLMIFYLVNKDGDNWSTQEQKTIDAITEVLAETLTKEQRVVKLKEIREQNKRK